MKALNATNQNHLSCDSSPRHNHRPWKWLIWHLIIIKTRRHLVFIYTVSFSSVSTQTGLITRSPCHHLTPRGERWVRTKFAYGAMSRWIRHIRCQQEELHCLICLILEASFVSHVLSEGRKNQDEKWRILSKVDRKSWGPKIRMLSIQANKAWKQGEAVETQHNKADVMCRNRIVWK